MVMVNDFAQTYPSAREEKSKISNLESKSQSSGTNASIPYVISPRNTFVDTRRPQLRWNPVIGAISYTVKIVADAEIVWQKEVEEAEYNSPKDLPLKVGVVYSLIVESDNGRSSKMDSNTSKAKFQMLEDEKNAELSNKIEGVKNLNLTEERKVHLLVDAYTEYGLNAKAIDILEAKITNESLETSLICLELAHLYDVVGFYQLAEEKYRKALSLATDEELRVKISAKIQLTELLVLTGREHEAKKIKAELDILKSGNLEQLTSQKECSGRCGECYYNDDPNDPGKWYQEIGHRICRTIGCE